MSTSTFFHSENTRTVTDFTTQGLQSLERIAHYDVLGNLQKKMVEWQAIRRLQAMDDNSLQDIGIERYEIRDFVAAQIH